MDLALRLERMVKRPKRTLASLTLALIAIAVAIGSGANFTSRAENPSNTFAAGIVKMDNSRGNAAILSAADLKPGAPPQTGTVDIENTGSLDMVVSLTRDQLTSSDDGAPNPAPFANKVNLTVTDCGRYASDGTPPACGNADDQVVYGPSASLASMSDSIGLGTFAKDEKHRYEFAAALDGSAGDEYAGDGSSARFVWDATQTP